MTPNFDFKSQSFNPFSVNEESPKNELDPDVNYYVDQISFLGSKYYVLGEVKDQLKSLQLNSFSVLHLNIRIIKKHFEAFQDFNKSSLIKSLLKLQIQCNLPFRNLASASPNFRFKFSAAQVL